VSIAGLDNTVRVGHPSCDVLQRHYKFQPFTLTDTTERVTPQIKTFLALQASLTARLFLKQPFPIVSVLNDEAGLQLLCALFLPFGQVVPVEINVNKRRESALVADEISNYPVFGNLSAADSIEGRNGYLFTLSRSGIPCLEKFDKELYDQVFTMAHQIQTQLSLALIREGKNAGARLAEEPKTQLDYMLEGQRLIEALTQYRRFDMLDTDLPHFRQVLSHIAFEDVSKYFRRDLASDTIFINFTKIGTARRQDVYKELASRHGSATMFKKHYIAINADFITELVGMFYGKPAVIFASQDTSGSDYEVQTDRLAVPDDYEPSETSELPPDH
jgi:hypothetical protein